jgi:hypothetical protein
MAVVLLMGPLLTVTVTPAEVPMFPAASCATAVSVCEPIVAVILFQTMGIRRGNIFRTEVGAVELELNAAYSHVIRCIGGDGD